MHQPQAWVFHEFGVTDPLSTELAKTTQVQYLCCYLTDLRTRWVLEEPSYFDRDYLSECSAFYSQSARDLVDASLKSAQRASFGAYHDSDYRRRPSQSAVGSSRVPK